MRRCHNGHPVLSTPRLDCFVRALKPLLQFTDQQWRYYVQNSKCFAISFLHFISVRFRVLQLFHIKQFQSGNFKFCNFMSVIFNVPTQPLSAVVARLTGVGEHEALEVVGRQSGGDAHL